MIPTSVGAENLPRVSLALLLQCQALRAEPVSAIQCRCIERAARRHVFVREDTIFASLLLTYCSTSRITVGSAV